MSLPGKRYSSIWNQSPVVKKYYGEQHEKRHPGELVWPGYFGLPLLGKPDTYPTREELNRAVPISFHRHKVFDLSDSEDGEYYDWVRDRCENGWFVIRYEERHWDDNKKSMQVYLEWVQRYIILKE